MTTIGFIGLGNMGLPMCQRLAAGNADVAAFDLRAEAVDAAGAAGAVAAGSAAECAERADLLLTSLPRPDHVEAVMVSAGALAALRPG
ncbi:MAG: NAD(P)-binding domain-containing protein, partial [Ilumatobacteraceae bacterium]